MSKEQIEDMIKEAEEYRVEDEAQKDRIESKNALENYLYNTRNTIDKPEVKLPDDAKKTILDEIAEKIKWLDDNQTATKGEYDDVLKESQEKINPIITKMYAEPGAANAGAANAEPAAADSGAGPTIDEVD